MGLGGPRGAERSRDRPEMSRDRPEMSRGRPALLQVGLLPGPPARLEFTAKAATDFSSRPLGSREYFGQLPLHVVDVAGSSAPDLAAAAAPSPLLDSPPPVLRQLCSGGEGCAAEAGMPRQPGRWDRHQGPLPRSQTTADARSRCNRVTPSLQSRHAFTAIASRSRCNRVTPSLQSCHALAAIASRRRWTESSTCRTTPTGGGGTSPLASRRAMGRYREMWGDVGPRPSLQLMKRKAHDR